MKKYFAIIGSGFGDEGKGLFTDYFSSKTKNGIVIRFNGGAQAGHTVVTPQAKRHVFSHFGAGAFCNLPTYLSEFYIINPILFQKEYIKLIDLGIKFPKVFINKKCLITTPYDMMINQFVEENRQNNRHGSCGIGINETVVRNQISEYRIEFELLSYLYDRDLKKIILEKLEQIRNKYVNYRMKELNIDISEKFQSLLKSNEIIERFMEDLEFILKKTTMTDFKLLDEYDDVIFEGAQGLLLDQNNELFFPHLTRSNTGITNINSIVNDYCNNFKNNVKGEIIYITRCYSTRHGAGKFNTELSYKPYKKIEDITNISNNYQGSIRFGWLDIDLLSESIKKDIKNKSNSDCISLGITCLDQIDDKENTTYVYKGELVTSSIDVFLENLKLLTGIDNLYLSYGNTREDISTL